MTQPLDYSRALYIGRRYFRTSLNIFVAIAGSLILIFFDACVAIYHHRIPIWVPGFAVIITCSVGWLWYCIFSDRCEIFTIEAEGIFRSGRIIPWSKVARFGAYPPAWGSGHTNLTLFYKTRPFTWTARALYSSHGISEQEYRKLIEDLRIVFGSNYPDLHLGGYEKWGGGGGAGG